MLEGRLGDFSLPDILRLLSFTGKTGRLWIEDGGVAGRIEVLEGRVRDASVDAARLGLARRLLGLGLVDAEAIERAVGDAGQLPSDLDLARRLVEIEAVDTAVLADLVREQTLDAVFELLRWEDGAFGFEAAPPASRGPSALDLAISVDELLDEASRRLEAHQAVRERTGPGDAVVSIRRPGRERAEVALTPEGWTLLALVDGRRTVADLVALCGQGDYRTRRTLTGLLDEGVVSIGDAASEAPGDRLLAANAAVAALEQRLTSPTVPPLGGHATPATAIAPDAPATPSASAEAAAAAPDAPPAPDAAVPEPDAAGASPADDPQPWESPPSPASDASPASAGSSAADPTGEQEAGAAPAADAPRHEYEVRPPQAADTPAAADAPPASEQAPEQARRDGDAQLDIDEVEITSGEQGHQDRRVTPLRAKVREERLRTDPEVDEDLVQRLMDGVESL